MGHVLCHHLMRQIGLKENSSLETAPLARSISRNGTSRKQPGKPLLLFRWFYSLLLLLPRGGPMSPCVSSSASYSATGVVVIQGFQRARHGLYLIPWVEGRAISLYRGRRSRRKQQSLHNLFVVRMMKPRSSQPVNNRLSTALNSMMSLPQLRLDETLSAPSRAKTRSRPSPVQSSRTVCILWGFGEGRFVVTRDVPNAQVVSRPVLHCESSVRMWFGIRCEQEQTITNSYPSFVSRSFLSACLALQYVWPSNSNINISRVIRGRQDDQCQGKGV